VRALAQCVEVLLEGLSGNAAARLPVLRRAGAPRGHSR
jgi:hypothetical protein